MNAHWSDAQAAAAEERGAARLASEPHAVSARYDRAMGRVIIELSNGASFAFPPRLAQDLREASTDDLAEVELVGSGLALHWPRIDADLLVAELLAGIFGTRAWMSQLARRAGQSRSPAKAAAARANGAKGGRPRKVA